MPSLRRAGPVLLAACLTLTVFFTTEVTSYNNGLDSDGAYYARMAEAPLFEHPKSVQAPWAYRVFTPALASVLPGPVLNRFRALAVVANVLSLFVMFHILKALGFAGQRCYLGALLYAGVFWTLKFSFYSPVYIDFNTNLFLLLIIYGTVTRRYVALLPVLALSALQKESLPLFSLFVAADLLHQNSCRPAWRTGALAVLIVFVPFACLRLLHAGDPSVGPSSPAIALEEARRFLDRRFWPVFIHAVFSGLGLLPVLLAARYRAWFAFLARRPAFGVYLLIAAGALLGGVDKARLFLYALPVAVCLAVSALSALGDEPVPRRRYALWVALFLCAHFYIGNCLTPLGTFEQYIAKLVPEHARLLRAGDPTPFLIRDGIAGAVLYVLAMLLPFPERRADMCRAS